MPDSKPKLPFKKVPYTPKYIPKIASKQRTRARQLERARREIIRETGVRDTLPKREDKLPFYERKEFKKLNKKWHDVLLESGFDDKEEFDSKLELMKQHENTKFHSLGDRIFGEKQRYYELAGQLVFSYKFESELDKDIWKLHSEGWSEREIFDKLQCPYNYVRKVVRTVRLCIKRDAKDILEDIASGEESND